MRAKDLKPGRIPRLAMSRFGIASLTLILGFLSATPSRAEVERLEIEDARIIAENRSFGLAGAYEKLSGTVYFSLDPLASANSRIVDLQYAPLNPSGRVEFSANFYLLRPVDPIRGNGTAFVEVSNRGGKASIRYFNRGAGFSLDPAEDDDFGDGFLMRQGFTIAWVGWQFDVLDEPWRLRLEPVIASMANPPLTGLARSDRVYSEPSTLFALGHRNHSPYPVSDPDDARNVLTVRDTPGGMRQVIPRSSWDFANEIDGKIVPDSAHIHYAAGFEPGRIYEVVYVAENPVLVGVGHAATRDFVAFLKNDDRSPAPVERAIGFGVSQTGRYLRHFVYQGFNSDVEGRRVFDGLMIHTAGAGRGSFNHRFGQPSRDAHRFSAFWYPTDVYPFSGATEIDSDTGLQEGLFDAALAADAMPKIFVTNSGYEYWGRSASLIHTRLNGSADAEPRPEVRYFHLASAQHFVSSYPPETRRTRWKINPLDFFYVLRSLLVDLNRWVTLGTEPVSSRIPTVTSGSLVPREGLALPDLPGIGSAPQPHYPRRADYGGRFRSDGIVDNQPPELGRAFGVLIPQVDADGNEIGGLRLPEIEVPLATYLPWNLRDPAIGAPHEMADFVGTYLPFSGTPEQADGREDPRPSTEERYASRAEYLGRYMEAAMALVRDRYLLAEDLPELLERAQRLWEDREVPAGK